MPNKKKKEKRPRTEKRKASKGSKNTKEVARKEAATVTERILQQVMPDEAAELAAGVLGFGADTLLGMTPYGGLVSTGAHIAGLWSPANHPLHPANKLGGSWTMSKKKLHDPSLPITCHRQMGTLLKQQSGSVPLVEGGGVPQPFHEEMTRPLPDGRIAHIITGRDWLEDLPESVTSDQLGMLLQSITLNPALPPLSQTRLATKLNQYGEFRCVAASLIYAPLCDATTGGALTFLGFRDPDRSITSYPDGATRTRVVYTLDEDMKVVQVWRGMGFAVPHSEAVIFNQFGEVNSDRSDLRFTSSGRTEAIVQSPWDNNGNCPGQWWLEYDFLAFEPVPTEEVTDTVYGTQYYNAYNSTDPDIYLADGEAQGASNFCTGSATNLPQSVLPLKLPFDENVFDVLQSGLPSEVSATKIVKWSRKGCLASMGIKAAPSPSDDNWRWVFPPGKYDVILNVSGGSGNNIAFATSGGVSTLWTGSGNHVISNQAWTTVTGSGTTGGTTVFGFATITSDGTGYAQFVRLGGTGAATGGQLRMSVQVQRVNRDPVAFDPLIMRYLSRSTCGELADYCLPVAPAAPRDRGGDLDSESYLRAMNRGPRPAPSFKSQEEALAYYRGLISLEQPD
jgi:hypothetical protein